jgi:hypothetical protein
MALYTTLCEDEIRLLILQPGESKAGIDCELIQAPLGDSIPYHAISYAWGNPKLTHSIKLRSGDAVTPAGVTGHLLDALFQFRQRDKPVTLWIDALCIDQNNVVEKSTQVMHMTEIFKNADSVWVWLGVGDDTSDMAMSFIGEILDFERLQALVHQAEYNQKWQGFNGLLKRAWFSRRWVVQEIAFADDVTLFCGTKRVLWQDFADAATIYAAMSRDSKLELVSHGIEEISCLGAYELIYASNNLFRRNLSGTRGLQRLVPIETLLQRLIYFQATEPRDVIYAILALARDTDAVWDKHVIQPSITINYAKPVWVLYREVISLIVDVTDSLDIIFKPWAPKGLDLPSWISDADSLPYIMDQNGTFVRHHADLFVGNNSRRSPYSACSHVKAETANRDFLYHAEPSKTMIAKGFVLDEVAIFGDAAISGIIPRTWLDLGGWKDIQNEAPPDSFWRTLVADRDNEGNHAPPWYQRICQYIFRKADFCCSEIDIERLIGKIKTPTLTGEFVQRVRGMTWNRKFMRSTINRFPGLIPATAQKGDLICILDGCSVPVVMRGRTKAAVIANLCEGEGYLGLPDGGEKQRESPFGVHLEPYVAKLREIYSKSEGESDDGMDVHTSPEGVSDKQHLNPYARQPPKKRTAPKEPRSISETEESEHADELVDEIGEETNLLKGKVASPKSGGNMDIVKEDFRYWEDSDSDALKEEEENYVGSGSVLSSPQLRETIDFECTVVGECFMYGAMDGEAMTLINRGGIESINFGIC